MGLPSQGIRQLSNCATHSHSRGINFEKIVPNVTLPDSFPLAWDKHSEVSCAICTTRFIPTHAGQALSFPRIIPVGTIHSHSRGTDFLDTKNRRFRTDSFPLAWDRLIKRRCKPLINRFIPTRVGQTSVFRIFSKIFSIHSHSRGTDDTLKKKQLQTPDSFPLAWDRLNFLNKFIRVLRFIPTRVGQTSFHAVSPSCGYDSFPLAWDRPYKWGLCIFAVHYILYIFVA